jgi:hypothetical protein
MKKENREETGGMFPNKIPTERLFFDEENPRLPEEVQGKSQSELLFALVRDFNLAELADSLAQNGYFREEPLVVIPRTLPKGIAHPLKELGNAEQRKLSEILLDERTKFTVVEGNRRLAACKILLDAGLRKQFKLSQWPTLSKGVANELSTLPVIVYVVRSEVVPYLGIRHIVGIQKWESFAKARYVARLVKEGRTVEEVETSIGDKHGSARKNLICYNLLRQLGDEFDYDTRRAKNNFSYLILAIGQGTVKRFLGIPSRLAEVDPARPVPKDKLNNLMNLASWMFGDSKHDPVIRESRDITSSLAHVLDSKEALQCLEATRRLEDAYDLSEGEEKMLLKYLRQAGSKLESALGIIHRHRTEESRLEVEKCADTIAMLRKTIVGGK